MKRMKWSCTVLLAVLLLIPGARALALGTSGTREHVIDRADIWTESEEAEFRTAIAELAADHDTDVVLLSVYLLQDDSLGDGSYSSAAEFADDFYDRNGYGTGSDRTGLILVVSMEPGNRQYHFSTSGREYEAYSSSDISYMEGEISAHLTGSDYDGAARRFLELVRTHEEEGHFTAAKAESSDMLWTFGLAALVAWAVTSSMRRRMNPVRKASSAQNYIVNGSYELRRYNEYYLGTTVTKTPRNRNGQGGGGGHMSASGFRHGGGGGRF